MSRVRSTAAFALAAGVAAVLLSGCSTTENIDVTLPAPTPVGTGNSIAGPAPTYQPQSNESVRLLADGRMVSTAVEAAAAQGNTSTAQVIARSTIENGSLVVGSGAEGTLNSSVLLGKATTPEVDGDAHTVTLSGGGCRLVVTGSPNPQDDAQVSTPTCS